MAAVFVYFPDGHVESWAQGGDGEVVERWSHWSDPSLPEAKRRSASDEAEALDAVACERATCCWFYRNGYGCRSPFGVEATPRGRPRCKNCEQNSKGSEKDGFTLVKRDRSGELKRSRAPPAPALGAADGGAVGAARTARRAPARAARPPRSRPLSPDVLSLHCPFP